MSAARICSKTQSHESIAKGRNGFLCDASTNVVNYGRNVASLRQLLEAFCCTKILCVHSGRSLNLSRLLDLAARYLLMSTFACVLQSSSQSPFPIATTSSNHGKHHRCNRNAIRNCVVWKPQPTSFAAHFHISKRVLDCTSLPAKLQLLFR